MLAQAKARKIDARLIVVDHPLGGLNAEELVARVDTATAALRAAVSL